MISDLNQLVQTNTLAREGGLTGNKERHRANKYPKLAKAPPKEFATISHGKIGAEEYKSLALVSFTITLIRLWGQVGMGALRERLEHFLHLTVAIRVLSFQTISESDVQAFEHYYAIYLNALKKLYPTCSVVPTQHSGLHIPYFLRCLGPGARFNENLAEMFIGMLQDFPTNWKLDDLGITIHNEFNMAADLQGLLQDKSILASIAEVGASINHYKLRRSENF
ncbi:hypothetical protein FRC10_011013 [Ceratobasidium sp. 414]|nr:hypothetical protein FRC10_011013 [Ceratobasidium sp. 414]